MAVKISVNKGNAGRAMEELGSISEKLCMLAEEIRICASCLHISSGSAGSIKESMESIRNQLLYEASLTKHFQHAAEYAISRYNSCENRILEKFESAEKEAERTRDRGTDKRGISEQFVDQILGEHKTAAYTATTEEQRVTADREFQLKIAHIGNAQHFSKDVWKQASIGERKNILQDYMQDISQALGVQVKKNIQFFEKEPVQGILTNGYYNLERNRIYINEYVINTYPPEDSYYLLTTILHELRHVYQNQAMKKPTDFQVDQETLDQWEENVRNYRESQTEGFREYQKQPVEADARVFAGQEGRACVKNNQEQE